MIACPDCGHVNIDGADICEQCQQPLTPLDAPVPKTEIEHCIFSDRIRSLSPRPPVCVDFETPVSEVLGVMATQSIGCVVVLDKAQPVGIFSERDALLRLNTDAERLAARPISEFMTPAPETLDMDDRIAYALHRMDLGGYRHIPLFSDGRLHGIISVRDILRYITANALGGR